MIKSHRLIKIINAFIVVFAVSVTVTRAQDILNKKISVATRNQRLDDVLSIIGNQGNFSFSYNSSILRRDSLVSISVNEYSVRQVLNMLLPGGYEYKESGNYVIIRRTALRITSVVRQTPTDEKVYSITGYIVNGETGEKIGKASIYEPLHLISTLTDDSGRFTIKLKRRHQSASLAISKASFEDTTVVVKPSYNMQLEIALVPVIEKPIVSSPSIYHATDTIVNPVVPDTAQQETNAQTDIEKRFLAKLFLTAKQKTQSLNIKKFFSEKPVQVSIWPGISMGGQMGSQVFNDFSLNIIGGYTGGVNIVEVGGVFNINRRDVKYFQVAGVFNMVGGNVNGMQAAGLHNTVLNNQGGVQVAGLSNIVGGNLKGIQVAGLGNKVKSTVDGVQVAGVFNYAKKLKGVQVGLVNIADSSDGYSIGLINVVLKGYHKLAISNNEITDVNIGFKTGSRKLYSILQAGAAVSNRDKKIYSFGYGLGTEIKLNNWLSFNPELGSNYLYTGSWDNLNLLNKLNADFNFRLNKKLSISLGPSFNLHYSDQTAAAGKYLFPVTPSWRFKGLGNSNLGAWVGWNAGINIF